MTQTSGIITHQGSLLLHQARRGQQRLCVREGNGLRWFHFDRHDVQAVIDLQSPARLVLPYTNAMLAALLFQPGTTRLLNLGYGGGSFERFLATHQPQIQVSTVEVDSQVVELTQRFFQPPPGHPVFLDCAERFLSRHQQRYDLIFCDMHQGNGHPDFMLQQGFLADAARCLSPRGVFSLNLLPNDYNDLLHSIMALRAIFPWIWLLDVPERRNMVMFCLKQPLIAGAQELVTRAAAFQHLCATDLPSLLPFMTRVACPAAPRRGA